MSTTSTVTINIKTERGLKLIFVTPTKVLPVKVFLQWLVHCFAAIRGFWKIQPLALAKTYKSESAEESFLRSFYSSFSLKRSKMLEYHPANSSRNTSWYGYRTYVRWKISEWTSVFFFFRAALTRIVSSNFWVAKETMLRIKLPTFILRRHL